MSAHLGNSFELHRAPYGVFKEVKDMAIYRLSIKICREAITKKIDYIQRNGRYGKGEKAEELREKWSINLPSWAKDAHDFWSAIEDYEKPGQVQARGIELALPVELSRYEQRELVKTFCNENLNGHACSVAIHDSLSGNNPHVHIYFCERKIDKSKVEPDRAHYCKQRSGYSKDRAITGSGRKRWLKNLRKFWENELNNALAKNGYEERVSCESLKTQGIDRIPQIHVGYKDYSLLRRTGKRGIRMTRNDEVLNANKSLLELQKENVKYQAKLKEIKKQKEEIEVQIGIEKHNREVVNQYKKIAEVMTLPRLQPKAAEVKRPPVVERPQPKVAEVKRPPVNERPQPKVAEVKRPPVNERPQPKAAEMNDSSELERQTLPRKKIVLLIRGVKKFGHIAPITLKFEDGTTKNYISKDAMKVIVEHGEDLQEFYRAHPKIEPRNQITKENLMKAIEKEMSKSTGRRR